MPLRLAFLMLFSLQMPAALADEVQLSPAYLAGTWSLGGDQGCKDGKSDYIVFRDNGTLEAGSGQAARVAGFWELNKDTVILHMLVAPRGGNPEHPFYQGSYFYQYRAAQVLTTRADSFDANVGAQSGGERHSLTRCR